MPAANILVVGGAGYIGSTTAYHLKDAGYDVELLDNLSTGYRELATAGILHEADLLDEHRLEEVFSSNSFDAVLHFAAFIAVGESVQDPLRYYRNNISGTINLLNAMKKHEVRRLVFSSTAAVYGEPQQVPIPEEHPKAPINPYGWSKRIMEQIFADCENAWGLKFVALRYFNAAGADPKGRTGEWHDPETHLIPVAMRAMAGEIPALTVFGEDYPTRDGSCIRDYIHIIDLAEAHRLALDHLLENGDSHAFNLGSETGYSVFEVIRAIERVCKQSVPHSIGPRREGDPAELIASSGKIRSVLGWQRKYSELDRIVADAWGWHKDRGFCGP